MQFSFLLSACPFRKPLQKLTSGLVYAVVDDLAKPALRFVNHRPVTSILSTADRQTSLDLLFNAIHAARPFPA